MYTFGVIGLTTLRYQDSAEMLDIAIIKGKIQALFKFEVNDLVVVIF